MLLNTEVYSEDEVVITIKSVFLNILLTLALLCSGTAFAVEGTLLGLTQGEPLINTNPIGGCDYNPTIPGGGIGTLTIETEPVFITFDSIMGDINVISAPTVATFVLPINNTTGVLQTGGTVTVTGTTSSFISGAYGSPLLTGDITDFGIRDDGTNDRMDIRAALSGLGSLNAIYPPNTDISATLLLEISDYAYDPMIPGVSGFSSSWTCVGPKVGIGPTPKPAEETCALTITKSVDKTEIGPFPPVSDDPDEDSDSDSGLDHDNDGDTDNSDEASSGSIEDDSGPSPTDCGCAGKVSKLVLKYTGPGAEVTITRTPHDVVVFPTQNVVTNQLIELNGPLGGPGGFSGTLGTNIEIVETGVGTTKIHTSCSQPIGPGLQVGDWLVISGESKKLDVPLCPIPPIPCAGEEVTYTYTVTNANAMGNGSPLTGINVVDVPLGTINDAPFDLAPGEVVVFNETVCLTQTTTNTVTASGTLPSGELCTSNTADATVEVLLPPDPGCPADGSSDSDSGIDGNHNSDSDDSDADSGNQDCDGDDVDPPPPPASLEGCSPGYWKQENHFDFWVGFTPGSTFENAFPGTGANTGNETLLRVLKKGGGKSKALGRQAVAAILNALNPNVNYQYNVNGVQQIVNDAYADGSGTAYNTAAGLLESANEKGCPLN